MVIISSLSALYLGILSALQVSNILIVCASDSSYISTSNVYLLQLGVHLSDGDQLEITTAKNATASFAHTTNATSNMTSESDNYSFDDLANDFTSMAFTNAGEDNVENHSFVYPPYRLKMPKFASAEGQQLLIEQSQVLLEQLLTNEACPRTDIAKYKVALNGSARPLPLPEFLMVCSGLSVCGSAIEYRQPIVVERKVMSTLSGKEVFNVTTGNSDNSNMQGYNNIDQSEVYSALQARSSTVSTQHAYPECVVELLSRDSGIFGGFFAHALPEVAQLLHHSSAVESRNCTLMLRLEANGSSARNIEMNALRLMGFSSDLLLDVGTSPHFPAYTNRFLRISSTPVHHPVLGQEVRSRLGLDRPPNVGTPMRLLYYSRFPLNSISDFFGGESSSNNLSHVEDSNDTKSPSSETNLPGRMVLNEVSLLQSLHSMCRGMGVSIELNAPINSLDALWKMNAVLLMGPHSEHLHKLWFLPRASAVVELMPKTMRSSHLDEPWLMSVAAGLTYYRSYGEPVGDGEAYDLPFNADIPDAIESARRALVDVIQAGTTPARTIVLPYEAEKFLYEP